MSELKSAHLLRASWLRRVLKVQLSDGVYEIEYSSRSLTHDRIFLNGQLEIQTRISSWFRPLFRFFVGGRPAVIAVRVAPWLALRSFHLLLDGQVVYCDRRRDLFEGEAPARSFSNGVDHSDSAAEGAADPLCPYCDRKLHGAGLDFASLPDELRRQIDAIGRPTAVFSFARQQRVALIVAGILACCFGIALLAVLLFLPEKNPAAEMQARHMGYFLGSMLLFVGPIAVFYALRTRRLHAITGSEGVALLVNDTVSYCRWEEIESVYETVVAGEARTALETSVRGDDHVFRVRCQNGKELVFRNYLNDLPWLGKIIERETLPYLLPLAVEALENGDTLSFGPITLDAVGLREGPKKELPWKELGEVKLVGGWLTIMQQGKRRAWLKTSRGQVPNTHILLALVRYYHSRESGDGGGETSAV